MFWKSDGTLLRPVCGPCFLTASTAGPFGLCFHVSVQPHALPPSMGSRGRFGMVCSGTRPKKSPVSFQFCAFACNSHLPLLEPFLLFPFLKQFSTVPFKSYFLLEGFSLLSNSHKYFPSLTFICTYSRENVNPWPKKEGASFLFFFFFYWRIVDIQYYVSFRVTAEWFGHSNMYVYIYILLKILFHYSLLKDTEYSSLWNIHHKYRLYHLMTLMN